MDVFDSRLADVVLDTSVYTLFVWKDGKGIIDAQTIHHVLSLLGDLQLPANDSLLDDIEQDISVSKDAESEFGLYSVALAKLDRINADRISAALQRLQMSRAELALRSARGLLNTPFSRDVLERLLICEALIIQKEQLSNEQLRAIIKHVQLLADEIAERDADREQSYPALLLALLAEQIPEKEKIAKVFLRLRDQIATSSELWYGESLPNNCFVVLNALRASNVIGSALALEIWQSAAKRLRQLAKNRASFFCENLSKTAIVPTLALSELLPYVRVLLAVPDFQELLRAHLVSQSSTAYDRVLQTTYFSVQDEHAHLDALGQAVRNVIAGSLVLESRFDKLAGGLSGSEVYVATVNVKQPFSISSQTVVFKVAEGAKHGKELRTFEKIQQMKLQDSFAAVLSKPATVQIGDEYPNILLYEHLAGFVTLRQLLQDQVPEGQKLRILGTVCERLAQKLYASPQDAGDPKSPWQSAVDRIAQVSSHLSLSKHPVFSAKIARMHDKTIDFLRAQPDTSAGELRRSMMHGDLNCRNIMVKVAGTEVLETKLIDYETLDFQGDMLLDVGELVEDAVLSCSFVRKPSSVEDLILRGLMSHAFWLAEEAGVEQRLLVARLRSLLLIIKHLLFSGPLEEDRLIYRAMSRWETLIEKGLNLRTTIR